jgi:hypothetical protein
METIGDIRECQGSGLSKAGFKGIEKFYESLIVGENPYMSFGEVIALVYLKALLCGLYNTK